MERMLILFIAISLDGYIAGEKDNLDFLEAVEKEGEDYGYSDFIDTMDTVIMGRKTYDWIMNHVPEFIHADKETYIITCSEKSSSGNINFYNGNLKYLVYKLKPAKRKNIFCDGGAEIVNELLKDKLIDEFIISIIPVFLGGGIRLFKDGQPGQNLRLVSAKTFKTGLVKLQYANFLELI